MQCVVCKQDNDRVVDSRACESGSAIRRRRECLACGRRFTTYERVEVALRMVIKKDGRREPFNREKVLGGMRTACQKRQISSDQLVRIADRLESELFGESDREVSSRAIGERVIEELKALDKVAFVRFASVYREFTDVMEFANVLMPFLPQEGAGRAIINAAARPLPAAGENGKAGEPAPKKSEWRKDLSKKDGRNGSHPGGP